MGGEQPGQALVCGVGLGGHHHPGGILVQPVDDARPGDATDTGQAGTAMVQQGVDEGAVRGPGGRVGGHARRLVQHDQVGVLEQDGQGQGLGLGRGRDGGRDEDFVDLAGGGLVRAAGDRGPVCPTDGPAGDQGLDAGPGQLGRGLGQGPIQPDAVGTGVQGDRQGLRPLVDHVIGVGVAIWIGGVGQGRSTREPFSTTR